jgi:GTP-binding protein Era
MVMKETQTRCGFVTLIGAPNAGKSTLINRLVGTKISIVSHKVQTTRRLIRGCVIEDKAQIIFVDTPGIFMPKNRLDRAMVTTAWKETATADVTCFLVDVRRHPDHDTTRSILEKMKHLEGPKYLVLNKVDTVERTRLLTLTHHLNEVLSFEETFMISALKGDGLDRFVSTLAKRMPIGPWLYPEDHLSDVPLRELAAEITREKVFERLHQELPYAVTVETTQWLEKDKGIVCIEQIIYAERDTQRKIILGKGGQAIKAIGTASRQELESLLEQKVYLSLLVKIKPAWKDDRAYYDAQGLEWIP